MKWTVIYVEREGGEYRTMFVDASEAAEAHLQAFASPSATVHRVCAIESKDETIAAKHAWKMGGYVWDPLAFMASRVDWHRKNGTLPGQVIAKRPSEPKKDEKPHTTIVQDWMREMEEDNPGEIARRAWAATMAACRGM